MTPIRPTAHIVFHVLSALAIPFGMIVAFLTAKVGFELTQHSTLFDIGPFLAISGAVILCALSLIMAVIWVAIYCGTPRWQGGTRIWTIIFSTIFAVNMTVASGFIQRGMSDYVGGPFVRTALEGWAVTLSEPGGFSIFLLAWPLLPMTLFLLAWRQRTFGGCMALPS